MISSETNKCKQKTKAINYDKIQLNIVETNDVLGKYHERDYKRFQEMKI